MPIKMYFFFKFQFDGECNLETPILGARLM
jgi:hypothetical protein